jgi:hypothetical protein
MRIGKNNIYIYIYMSHMTINKTTSHLGNKITKKEEEANNTYLDK